MSYSVEILNKLVQLKDEAIKCLPEIEDLDVTCKSTLKRYLNDMESIDSSGVFKIQAIIDYMHEQIHIGNWKKVPLYIRKTVTIATYLKLLGLVKGTSEFDEDAVRESFKTIDFGLIFGCSLDNEPELLQDCVSILQPFHDKIYSNVNLSLNSSASGFKIVDTSKYHTVETMKYLCVSMSTFYSHIIQGGKPVIIDDSLCHWPAFTKWKDHNYFVKVAGMRMVAVELGNKYTDKDWTQKLMTVEEFVKNHICQNEVPGYLAQYQLFNQIPQLKGDIIQPEYCCFSENDDEMIDIMAWYGPKGTISPLHHDPKKNLLAQVVGEKQLFLFAPEDSENVYPHEHDLLHNTARVDPSAPDLEKFPNYKNAKPYHCVLRAGQMLYIPPKWWHYVESLSISFSVSFWWN